MKTTVIQIAIEALAKIPQGLVKGTVGFLNKRTAIHDNTFKNTARIRRRVLEI